MQVSTLILIVVLSAVTYRVGRFIVLDTMFEGTRARVFDWLLRRESKLRYKLAELIGCPYCITVWIAAAVCFGYRIFVGPLEAPVAVWLAVCTGALLYWRAIDWKPDDDEDE